MNWFPLFLAASTVGAASLAHAEGSHGYPARSAQVIRDGSFELEVAAAKAMPLFTPEGERAWAPGWDPRPIFPEQTTVAFQPNAVFRLDHGDEHAIWTILEADPVNRVAEYVYVIEGQRVSRVRVQIDPLGENRCRVHVRYVHTAISGPGLAFIAECTEEAYAQKMRDWRRMISAAIR